LYIVYDREEAKRIQKALFKFSLLNLLMLIKVSEKQKTDAKAPDSLVTRYKFAI